MSSQIVIGAGNWGTAIAMQMVHAGPTRLWVRNTADAAKMNDSRQNQKYLPGIDLPQNLVVEESFSSAILPDDRIILVVPSRSIVDICEQLAPLLHPNQVIVNASKGVESHSLRSLGQIIEDHLPHIQFVSLTGPTIAREIVNGEPTKAVLSSRHLQALLKLSKEWSALPQLWLEMSRDVEGAELCAALKGIIAIGMGMCDGANLHTNLQGVLMTYGLAEFREIARFLEVSEETVWGLSGVGDLFTTCISPDSRNRRFGRLRAQGVPLKEALNQVGMVVEGVSMAKSISELSHFHLRIPLFECLAKLIEGDELDIKFELLKALKEIR